MAGVNIVIDTMDPATENEMSLDGIKLLLNNQWDEAHKLFAKHRLVVRNCAILSPMMEISGTQGTNSSHLLDWSHLSGDRPTLAPSVGHNRHQNAVLLQNIAKTDYYLLIK